MKSVMSIYSIVDRIREQVESSRANLAMAELGIGKVKGLTLNLSTTITETRKHQVILDAQQADRQQQQLKLQSLSGDGTRHGESEQNPRLRSMLQLLPPDLKSYLVTFLDVCSVAQLERTNKHGLDISICSQFWLGRVSLHGGVGGAAANRQTVRRNIMAHGQTLRRCIEFIELLKEQRAVDKHKSISARRYVRHEPTITHPLPLHNNDGSATDKIMSRCETFNSDFRAYATSSLQCLISLSENPRDDIAYYELAARSTLTVLVSLLSNEAGNVQQLACRSLANLLACEAVHVQGLLAAHALARPKDGQWGTDDPPEEEDSLVAISKEKRPFAHQMRLADGVKMMFTLLTSPTATVNLVHGGSSAVQGMCNSDAARALVCLFAPKTPVRPRVKMSLFAEQEEVGVPGQDRCARQNEEERNVLRMQSDISELHSLTQNFPVVQPWLWTYYSKSGSVKDSHVACMCLNAGSQLFGRGADMNGTFEMSGNMTQTIEGPAWVIHKAYLSIAEIFNTSSVESVDEWVTQDCPVASEANTRSTIRAHMIHTLYFSGSDSGGNFLAGFYGVWETSAETHFHLEKGGVLRVTPIM